MELEVFVPTAAARVREALSDPERVARALPGFQRDAGADDPTSGRLKVRVGGHTITYRGALRVAEREDGAYTVEGEAAEARGTGTVKLSLTLTLADADDDGTRVTVEGSATADGRIAQLPTEQVNSALTRLVNRIAENLGATEAAAQTPEAPQTPEGPQQPEAPEAAPEAPKDPPKSAAADAEDPPQGPPAPDNESSTGGAGGNTTEAQGAAEAEQPPPEAAHARRTMIGRSAEEVDHAPPRGRYAPVPAPPVTAPAHTLRWAAPAAALAVASAIVVGRVLRRRR
ncbi:SRPBCC domain-containing protein [Streptomyces sp. NPDC054829]